MGFWGDFGGGAKIFGGNPPRNAMITDLRRLVKKYGYTVNTLVCTRGKEIKNAIRHSNVLASGTKNFTLGSKEITKKNKKRMSTP